MKKHKLCPSYGSAMSIFFVASNAARILRWRSVTDEFENGRTAVQNGRIQTLFYSFK